MPDTLHVSDQNESKTIQQLTRPTVNHCLKYYAAPPSLHTMRAIY